MGACAAPPSATGVSAAGSGEGAGAAATAAAHMRARSVALTAGDGAIHVEHVADDGVDLLRIASRDRAGLFSHIAGVLAMHGLDVVGASAATGADGVANATNRQVDLNGEPLPPLDACMRCRTFPCGVARVLTGDRRPATGSRQ